MREMKDSGVAWIGSIPSDWSSYKMKYLGRYINGYAFKPEDWGTTGFPIIRIQDLTGSNDNPNFYDGQLSEKYHVYNGDILVSWAATLDAFVWDKGEGWLNQHIFKAIPDEKIIDFNYYFWLLKTAMTYMNDDNKHGIMMQHVTLPVFNNFTVPVPPKSEQIALTVVLGTKARQIDALIANVQAQIEKLKAYKQSVITETVTRGLDPSVPMKDSGIQWLPTMPIGWKLSRIKNEIIPLERPVLADDEVITCFRDGVVTLRRRRREDGFTVSFTEHGYQGVEIGDLVIHGMDTFAGAIGCSDSRGKTTPVVHVCRTTGNNRYFMYFLRSMAYNHVYMDFSNGVRIRSSDFRNFAKLAIFDIIVPPLDEQDAIVEYLDSKSAQIDRLLALKQAKIDKLNEYKKSFIYEYVTGKREA